ncbi:MAG TPA: MFS transporter, partial [Cyclobacteriaceae bacterium]|nr:MFS transporter [Cyclobacteriaceae bacterium]
CHIDFEQSRTILLWAILFATPMFVVFGSWSDKVGRKWIMMIGMLLAVVTYRPLFGELLEGSDPSAKTELTEEREVVTVLKPVGTEADTLRTVTTKTFFTDGTVMTKTKTEMLSARAEQRAVSPDVKVSKTISGKLYWYFVAIVWVMIVYVTMVYGPIAAFLVEMFPTRIRYTSMSLPYHIGNGVFGRLTPFIATLFTTIYTGDKLVGLWYPIVITALCLVIGTLYISNRIDSSSKD